MTFSFLPILIASLAGAAPMADTHPEQSLRLEISEEPTGTISVSLKADSKHGQLVSYELQTTGASTSTHKGSTRLTANKPATLSTIRFSAQREWCVALNVIEQSGAKYTIEKGGACG